MSADRPVFGRAELIDAIARASVWGCLGLFVGTGFSSAATSGKAPSFEELLRLLIKRLAPGIELDGNPAFRLKSLPQIASELLRITQANSAPPERAAQKFREEIAHLCNLTPNPLQGALMTAALQRLCPSWVMTTNYDLVAEALLETGITVLPDQPLVARPDTLPIYHLHGHRLSPASIKITEEDYVGLLGPIDYQRLKLPLLFIESTMVLLGYALGDINVRAAMASSRSFKGSGGLRLSSIQGLVIQALYNPAAPKPEPYYGENGELIVEITSIPAFLKELADCREAVDASLAAVREAINNFLANPKNAEDVASPGTSRDTFLVILEKALPISQPTRLIEFLNRALDPIWEKARQDGGFEYYNVFMSLLVEVLARIKPADCNPSLISYLAEALENIGWYIDPEKKRATAWTATDTWIANHGRLAAELKRELRS